MNGSGSSGRTALVTGASTGVGYDTALAFARAGWRVLATVRDLARGEAVRTAAHAEGLELALGRIDVTDPGSIDAGVADALARFGGLDVLVNNAGAGFLGSVEQTDEADLKRVMDTNFFGVWRMTRAVLPHMRRAGAGRIISVTSVGGLIGQPFNEAYCAAKFAVEGMMEGLAPIARRMGLHVSLIEPGPINTEFVANVRATSAGTLGRLEPPYDSLVAAYMASSGDVFAQYGQTGADIAKIILEAATAERPHFRYVTSDFAKMVVAPKVVDMTGDSVVEAFARRLGAG